MAARRISQEKTYLCIDLKSFYASVECADRGLDPFTVNLVVADPERTEKTICLAITPAMKELGVRNRCRVFEIPKDIRYIMATPRMHRYMEVSAQIYAVYLRYVSPEDIHVYSIDECFIDATPYLALYDTDAREFATMLMDAVFKETHICATAGIGTNLFLCKVALDITAKHVPSHIGYLGEQAFMREIWFHRPITDVWNIGPGIARRLAKYGVYDLAGVAAMDPRTLRREFGVNAEYLIDHAWGQEPCTIAQIRSYTPATHSLGNGQVLPCDYTFDEAHDVLREMVDATVLDLTEKGLACERIGLSVGYAHRAGEAGERGEADVEHAGREAAEAVEAAEAAEEAAKAEFRPEIFEAGHGVRVLNARHGRTGGTRKLERPTNSESHLMERFEELYFETTRRDVPIRRINIVCADLVPEGHTAATLFDDIATEAEEHRLQEAVVAVRGKFGKNAMLKGTSLRQKATARERNGQIGGHRA